MITDPIYVDGRWVLPEPPHPRALTADQAMTLIAKLLDREEWTNETIEHVSIVVDDWKHVR